MAEYQWKFSKQSDNVNVSPSECSNELVDSFQDKIRIQRGNIIAAVIQSNPDLASWVIRDAYKEALARELELLQNERQD